MRHIHFIAIGGQSMSGIARILLSRGYKVTGSDVRRSDLTDELLAMGATVSIGHRAQNVEGADEVVVSSAISEDNPELVSARAKGIPVAHRMDMLLSAVNGKRQVAIAGAHGKTTVTSMIAFGLSEAKKKPTYLVGAGFGKYPNALPGEGPDAVFETDESDGSFLKCHPDVAVVTNVDNDHMEYWGTLSRLEGAFRGFLGGVREGGTRIVCGSDPFLAGWAKDHQDALTYSSSARATWEARELRQSEGRQEASIYKNGEHRGVLKLGVLGAHNMENALGALLAMEACGVGADEGASHLERYPGAKRRMERIGLWSGVHVFDDFSHHPSEIKAAVGALRAAFPEGRIIVAFQPHRYARTSILARDFGRALALFDTAIVTGIYAGPGEEAIPGVDSRAIQEAALAAGARDAMAVPEVGDAVREAASRARPGDVVVTMGAGDIWKSHGTLRDALDRSAG